MNRMDHTQPEKHNFYNRGIILQERMEGTIAFKFLGNHYTSSTKRNKPYAFKSRWHVLSTSTTYKLWLIATGKVRRMVFNNEMSNIDKAIHAQALAEVRLIIQDDDPAFNDYVLEATKRLHAEKRLALNPQPTQEF